MPKRLTDDLKAKLASMHNATPSFLCDELGNVRAQIKVLQEEESLIKTVLATKLENNQNFQPDKEAIKGGRYILQVIKTKVSRFSQEAAKKFLSEDQFNSCFVESDMTQYRVKRIDEPEGATMEPSTA